MVKFGITNQAITTWAVIKDINNTKNTNNGRHRHIDQTIRTVNCYRST